MGTRVPLPAIVLTPAGCGELRVPAQLAQKFLCADLHREKRLSVSLHSHCVIDAVYSGSREHRTFLHRNVGKPDIQGLLARVKFESQKLCELFGNEVFGRAQCSPIRVLNRKQSRRRFGRPKMHTTIYGARGQKVRADRNVIADHPHGVSPRPVLRGHRCGAGPCRERNRFPVRTYSPFRRRSPSLRSRFSERPRSTFRGRSPSTPTSSDTRSSTQP